MRRTPARHRHSAAHKGLTVLMNAGPWLPVPPHGYGGIENVVATLVPELRRRGVRVVLCTVQESTLDADRRINTFAQGQFASLAGPYNKVSGIGHAHMQEVCKALRADPSIDLVHDHMEVVGLSALALLDDDAPPALHTLHWDLCKHADFYANFDGHGRVFVNGVSEQQLSRAPLALQAQAVGAVPLATSVPDEMPRGLGDDFVMLGRITQDKGQDIAARACSEQGWALRMAGPVGPVSGPDELPAALEDDGLRRMADVAYYLESVRPLEDDSSIRWIGAVAGAQKRSLLINAKALLFPIQWEEPGGTAVIEALAVGTPVIGMRRGVLPDLVDHGVTGFLAETEEEFTAYLDRIDEIDRAACHRAALERFSPAAMADRYLELYHEVLDRADRHGVRPVQQISNTA